VGIYSVIHSTTGDVSQNSRTLCGNSLGCGVRQGQLSEVHGHGLCYHAHLISHSAPQYAGMQTTKVYSGKHEVVEAAALYCPQQSLHGRREDYVATVLLYTTKYTERFLFRVWFSSRTAALGGWIGV
jgi:hypothetical protein